VIDRACEVEDRGGGSTKGNTKHRTRTFAHLSHASMACVECACDSVAYIRLSSTKHVTPTFVKLFSRMPPIARHRDLLTHTRLRVKSGKSPVSAVARVERRGRQLHGACWETAFCGAPGDELIIERVFQISKSLSRIAVGQSTAGLHGAPAASAPPIPPPFARLAAHPIALSCTRAWSAYAQQQPRARAAGGARP
jgi:hypothetical protein